MQMKPAGLDDALEHEAGKGYSIASLELTIRSRRAQTGSPTVFSG